MNSSPPHELTFKDRLAAGIKSCRTSVCVGIDPATDRLSPFFEKQLQKLGIKRFLVAYSQALIDASVGRVSTVKFQSAYYEAHGVDGFEALYRSIEHAKSVGQITILDAKRGDISSTMSAYGAMAFDAMGADALTVTPYMGLDVVEPLLPWIQRGKGVYVVWLSSNPGSALIQEAQVDGAMIIMKLHQAIREFERKHQISLGLVLGATKSSLIPREFWAQLTQSPLLMPGLGAQGGVLTADSEKAIHQSGCALLPLSRALASTSDEVETWGDLVELVRSRIRSYASEM